MCPRGLGALPTPHTISAVGLARELSHPTQQLRIDEIVNLSFNIKVEMSKL